MWFVIGSCLFFDGRAKVEQSEFRRLAAYHEAGHAFADWRTGGRLVRIDMMTANPTTFFRAAPGQKPRQTIMQNLAGPLAERRVCDDIPLLRRHGRTDFLRSTQIAAEVCGGDRAGRDQFLTDIFGEVTNLLAAPAVWRAISDLARLLQQVKTLDGKWAVAVIEVSLRRRLSA
ncbi:MAG: hypothetical protein NTY19_26055 [Planctomycetota bacterium]|nr:hypothetical protein [Planctomycetota bacterium]